MGTMDGLWSAVFRSGEISGGGVIYLSGGSAVGGDSQYYYLGTYFVDEKISTFSADLKIQAFVAGAVSIVGVPMRAFSLKVSGRFLGEVAFAQASIKEVAGSTVEMQLVRRAQKTE